MTDFTDKLKSEAHPTEKPESSPLPVGPAIEDACPKWADELIRQLLALEIRLGNIRAGTHEQWTSTKLQEVLDRVDPDEMTVQIDNATTDILFRRVARGLTTDGYEPDTIACFINDRLTPGRGLRYCDAAEVREALLDS